MKVVLVGAYPAIGYSASLTTLEAACRCDPALADTVQFEQICARIYHGDYTNLWAGVPSADQTLLVQWILDRAPDLVAMSCYPWNVGLFGQVSMLLKEARPELPIVYGGPIVAAAGAPTPAVATHRVDVIVVGEAEHSFPAVLRAYGSRHLGDLDRVPGLLVRRDASLVPTGTPRPPADLSVLPSPILTCRPRHGDWLSLETYRGCPFRCTYCNWGKVSSIRFIPDSRIEEELRYVLERRVRRVDFLDSVFNLKTSRADRFLQMILDHYNGVTRFSFEIFLEGMAESTMELLGELAARGGVNLCEIGLQSSKCEVAAAVRRSINLDRFVRKLETLRCRAPALETTIDLISGLPGDDFQSFAASLDVLLRLRPHHFNVFPCAIVPGTELWETADQLDIRLSPVVPSHVVATTTFPAAALVETTVVARYLRDLFYTRRRTLRFVVVALGPASPTGFVRDLVREFVAQKVSPCSELGYDLDGFRSFFVDQVRAAMSAKPSTAPLLPLLEALAHFEARAQEIEARVLAPRPSQRPAETPTERGAAVLGVAPDVTIERFPFDLVALYDALDIHHDDAHVRRAVEAAASQPRSTCIAFVVRGSSEIATSLMDTLSVPLETERFLALFHPPCSLEEARLRCATLASPEMTRGELMDFAHVCIEAGLLVVTGRCWSDPPRPAASGDYGSREAAAPDLSAVRAATGGE